MTSPHAPHAAYAPEIPRAYPVFVRSKRHGVLAGVASGLAGHLGVDVLYVRAALLVGTLISGLGVFVYAGLWIFTTASENAPEPPDSRKLKPSTNLALAGLGVLAALLSTLFFSGGSVALVIPLVVVGMGAFLAWQAYDRGTSSVAGIVAFFVGAGLVIGGLGITIVWWDTGGMAGSLAAVVLTLAGVVVLAGPAALRLWESAASSRAEKVAAEERAEIAARLHDSVLQTLALIQKRAGDPEEVARLARGQERELRGWLFEAGEKANEQTVLAAVDKAAGEVEDMYGVRIAPVTVGTDRPLDERGTSLVMAAREAMVNAAKHAGVDTVDVYAELVGGELSIFVRDRGRGFDPATVPGHRHGIADSIVARVEKAGGQASVTSAPGEGAEVVLTLTCGA